MNENRIGARQAGMRGLGTGLALAMLCSGALIYVAATRMDGAAALAALADVNAVWLIPAILLQLLTILIKSVRWRIFLTQVKEVKLRNAVSALALGNMANSILLYRVGTLVRAWALGSSESVSKSAVLGSVVTEHAVDGVAFSIFIFIVLAFAGINETLSQNLGQASAAAFVIFVIFSATLAGLFVLHKRGEGLQEILVNRLAGGNWLAGKVVASAASFTDGLRALGNWRRVTAIVFWTVVWWTMAGAVNYFYLKAAGWSEPLLFASYFLFIAHFFGMMIPSSPGFIGTYHAAAMAGLMALGATAEAALPLALLMHAVTLLMNVAPGLLALYIEGVSFNQIRRARSSD